METAQRFEQGLNLCFYIFKFFSASALFQRAAAAGFRKNRRKIFHKVMGAGLLVFTNQVQRFFALKKGTEIGGIVPNTAEAQRAAFAGIPGMPTPTTASRMAVGAITAMHSIDAREAAQPVPPATMSTLTILLLTASGQA